MGPSYPRPGLHPCTGPGETRALRTKGRGKPGESTELVRVSLASPLPTPMKAIENRVRGVPEWRSSLSIRLLVSSLVLSSES